MILSIGEILADLIGEEAQIVRMYCGGAPFNVAVNAKQAGAQVCFAGKAGRDVVGDFLENACGKFGLDECRILRDPVRNTTLAFVTLDRGERKFSFFRRDTADFHLNRKELRGVWERADLVHIGSLMLSERSGQVFAKSLVRRAKREGKTVSFDMNLREDLFADADAARRAYRYFVEEADILKLSEDEVCFYTQTKDVQTGIAALGDREGVLFVTLGASGSYFRCGKLEGTVPSEPLVPVDTTGAGDAFFGEILARMDGQHWRSWDRARFTEALAAANARGGAVTQFRGAVRAVSDPT